MQVFGPEPADFETMMFPLPGGNALLQLRRGHDRNKQTLFHGRIITFRLKSGDKTGNKYMSNNKWSDLWD